MATATLKKRQQKANAEGFRLRESLDEGGSQAFYMPAGSMSFAEFREWSYANDFPERGLIAYIGDEIFIDMNPQRLNSHGSVQVAICSGIGSFVRKKRNGRFFVGRTRIANVPAVVSTEPDALFIAWESFVKGQIRYVPTKDGEDSIELEGTPDWILEIVGSRSVTKDKIKLRAHYYRAGIPEYWLIDARGDQVDFQILSYGKDDYEPAKRSGDWQTSKVFGKKFRLRRIKDELGDVDYRLDVK